MNRSNIANNLIGWSTVFTDLSNPILKIYKPSDDNKEVNSELKKVVLGIESDFEKKESSLRLCFDFSSEKEAKAALSALKDLNFPEFIFLSRVGGDVIFETRNKKDFFLEIVSLYRPQPTDKTLKDDIKLEENIVSVLNQLENLGFQGINACLFQDMKKTLGIMKEIMNIKCSDRARDVDLWLNKSRESAIKWAEDLHKFGDKNVSYHLACALENEPELAIYIFSKVPKDSEFYDTALLKMAEMLVDLPSSYKKPSGLSYLEVNNDPLNEEKAVGDGTVAQTNAEKAFSLLLEVSHFKLSDSDSKNASKLRERLFSQIHRGEAFSPQSSEATGENQQSGSRATLFNQNQANQSNRGLEEAVTEQQNTEQQYSAFRPSSQ